MRRLLDLDPAGEGILNFIKERLEICEQHEECREPGPFRLLIRDGVEPRNPTRLLRIKGDSVNQRVILTRTMDEVRYLYVALSHCWGSNEEASKIPVTTEDNFEERQARGVKVAELTRTFREAVDLTVRLGMEFIWIDSLCIIQDNKEDWENECPNMGNIYGRANLVIGAAHAKDGQEGLYHAREAPHRIEFVSPGGHPVKANVKAMCLPVSQDTILEQVHDVWKKGEQFWTAGHLPLMNRAWAFQERMLARRIVYFTPSELVWECRREASCECGDLQDPRSAFPEFGPGRSLKTKYQHVVSWGSDSERTQFWHNITAQFSARQITYHEDRLPALASIARQIDMPGISKKYICGLWRDNMRYELLWWSEFQANHPAFIDNTHTRSTNQHIPSWSWLSIEGRVSTWGCCIKPLIIINDVSYTLTTQDQYGPCKEATLSVTGRTVRVDAYLEQVSAQSKMHIAKQGGTDMYMVLADTNPLEYTESELKSSDILVLIWSLYSGGHIWCMVVRRDTNDDRYKRVGLVLLPDNFYQASEEQRLVLI